LAAGLFFDHWGIVAQDPNSYLCVVGEMASGAAAFFERSDYLSANAVYPERNFPFRRVFDIFGNMFAMKSRVLSTHW
jgi:hypothetical protein